MLPSIIIAICITVLVIIVAYGYHKAGLKANQENFLRKILGLPHLSIYKSFLHESFLPQKFPAIIMVQPLYIYLVPLHGNYMYLSHGKLALVFYTLENVRCYSMIWKHFLCNSISNNNYCVESDDWLLKWAIAEQIYSKPHQPHHY